MQQQYSSTLLYRVCTPNDAAYSIGSTSPHQPEPVREEEQQPPDIPFVAPWRHDADGNECTDHPDAACHSLSALKADNKKIRLAYQLHRYRSYHLCFRRHSCRRPPVSPDPPWPAQ